MNLTRISAIAMIAWSCLTVPLEAQSLKNVQAPAEFPPSSFQGKQYVDSRGCVFIRAGIGGETTWVPRVTRSRKLICGQKPTFESPQVVEAEPAPRRVVELTLDAPAEVEAPTPVPAPARQATAPRPDPTTRVEAPRAQTAAPAAEVAQAQPAPQPTRQQVVRVQRAPEVETIAAPRVAQPAPVAIATADVQEERTRRVVVRRARPAEETRRPARVARQAVAPLNVPVRVVRAAPQAPEAARATPAQQVARAQPACSGVSAISARYINNGTRYPVRCGPQQGGFGAPSAQFEETVLAKTNAAPISGTVRQAAPRPALEAARVPAHTRVVPRHVYEERLTSQDVSVPKGYAPVWDDDRLNPKRAEQTLAGDARMKLVWTSTVPRRLIDQRTGRDVTARTPLVFPFTNLARQKQELGEVSIVERNGMIIKRVDRRARAKQAVAAKPASVARAKAAAPAKKPATSARGRYVQVGIFDGTDSARRAAGRLQAVGLTVRMGKLKRMGKSYRSLVLGPYNSASQLDKALRMARAQGFSKAFIRK